MRASIVIAALLAWPAHAEAKYDPCRSLGEMWLAPAGRAPRNLKIWLADHELRGVELRLRGPGVDRVASVRRGEHHVDFGVLAPDATYELSVPAWGDWVAGTFTTGDDIDRTAPRAPRIRALAANDLAIDLDLSDETVFVALTVEGRTYLVWRGDLGMLGRTACAPWTQLVAGRHTCVTARAVDLAGNVGEPATGCTTVVDRRGDSEQAHAPLWGFPPARPPAKPRGAFLAALVLAVTAVSWKVVRRRRDGGRLPAMRLHRVHKLLLVALATVVSVPAVAEAGRRDHRGGGSRVRSSGHAPRVQMRGTRPGRDARPRVRDHRGTTVRPPPRGDRPYVWRHRHYHYWPYYWGFGYWPYYGYHDGYYATYYGPPAYAEAAAPPPPRPRPVIALGLHLGQLEGDRTGNAGTAGLAVRWRGAMLEAELELGRRALHDSDVSERSLAANLYLNLGNRDRFHPYLVGGVGALEGDRVFGAVGAGLALPVASRLTLAGDLRLGSVAPREMTDARIDADAEQTFEGRIGLLLDF